MDANDDRWEFTVRAVAEAGGRIVFSCWRCSRRVERPAAELVEAFGDRLVAVLPTRCTRCEDLGLGGLPYVRIAWPGNGVPPVTPPRTLRALERAGLSITIKCRACRRWTLRRPHWYDLWIKEHGHGADDITLEALRPRLRCSCGARAASIVIDHGITRDQYRAS